MVAGGHNLAYQWFGGAGPALVFLHEGLGSIRQWRDFPQKVAEATGCRALVYDRYGYGNSDVLQEPRVGVRFMHDGALKELPALLAALNIENPILVGHSDGASIALIHAGQLTRCAASRSWRPHVFIEEFNLASIRKIAASFRNERPEGGRLGKYHRDPREDVPPVGGRLAGPGIPATGTSRNTCRASAARCWRSRARRTNTAPWRSWSAIARQVNGPCELLTAEAHAATRRSRTSRKRFWSRFRISSGTCLNRTARADFRIIALVALAHGLSHFFQIATAVLFPLIKDDLGVSYVALGGTVALYYVVSGICQTLAGFAVDRYGARRVLFLGLALATAGARARGTRAQLPDARARRAGRRRRQQRLPPGATSRSSTRACARSASATPSAGTASPATSATPRRPSTASRWRPRSAGAARCSARRDRRGGDRGARAATGTPSTWSRPTAGARRGTAASPPTCACSPRRRC